MSPPGCYQLYTNAEPGQTGHDVILQSLDTWRNYTSPDGTTKKLFFGVENFEGTEPTWKGTQLIYGKLHPKTAYKVNSAAALKESDGREVGQFIDPKTVTVGSPRFEGKFTFTDPEVQALHDAGELCFSSGFISDIDDEGKLVGKVIPDHILVFKKTKDGIQPQDGGTMFLNAARPTMDDESKGYLKTILEMLGKLVPSQKSVLNASPPIDPEKSLETQIEAIREALRSALGLTYPDGSPMGVWIAMTLPDSVIWEHPVSGEYYSTPYKEENGQYTFGTSVKVQKTFTEKPQDLNMTEDFTNKIAVLNATIETQTASLTEKDATIADLTTKVQGFEAEKAQAEAAAQEAAWQNIKTNILAPGLTATPELEAEQKAQWLKDKDGFYCNAITAGASRPQPKGKTGEMFANAVPNEDAEMDAILSAHSGVPGSFH